MKKYIWLMGAAVLCLGAVSATAAEVSLSGFGTVGYAVSDQSFTYQRFLSDKGTFMADSKMGAQLDFKLNSEFSITVQGKIAPSMSSDVAVDPALSWAFLSWRPTNDWLVRLGRMRGPFYLQSQNMEVGTTFDFARLPVEVYNMSQTNDGDGIQVSKTWNVDSNEFILDGYFATAETYYRSNMRNGIPAAGLSAGPNFGKIRYVGGGLALTLHRGDDTYRAGVIRGNVRALGDQVAPVTYPYVSLGPGVGYYQTSNMLPGPGVPIVKETHATVYLLGADIGIGNDFRVMAEYALRDVPNSDTSPNSQSGYIAVLRPIDRFVPYASVAWIQPLQQTRDLYNRVNNSSVPSVIPNAAVINAAQQAGADATFAYDQITFAIGSSYRVSPTTKVKAEWAHTETGDMSTFVDAPTGGESGHKVINVFSLSYNFVF